MSQTITAIIPAKGHSSRLPNKNLLPFGDSNLLVHKIRQLKAVEEITHIIVSSESDEILKMAEDEGVIAIKRPQIYSDEVRPFSEFLHYAVSLASDDHIMWACCTSPLVEPPLYKKGIQTYFEKLNEGYDSLITVLEYKHYLLDEKGPLTFKWGPEHKNSQDLPMLHFFTDGILLAPRESMLEWSYYFGHNPYRMVVDKRSAVDIDDVYDYEFAKVMLNMK